MLSTALGISMFVRILYECALDLLYIGSYVYDIGTNSECT